MIYSALTEHWLKWVVVAASVAVCSVLWFGVRAWAEDVAEDRAKARVEGHEATIEHIDIRDIQTAVEVGKVDRRRLEDKIDAQASKLDAILDAVRRQ